MLLHYLVKVEKPKMHVNTTSAFDVNYKIAVTCIKLHRKFHKMFWWIISMSMRSKCPPPAYTHDLRWSCQHWWRSYQSQNKFASSVFAGRRCHESLFHTRFAVQHPK